MQGNEFGTIIEELFLKNNYDGVYSIDTIPKTLRKGHFFICNTDFSWNEGTHWILFLRPLHNCIEIFDSLGFDKEKQNLLLKYWRFRIKFLEFNETGFQSESSSLCGGFVLLYIYHRLHNLDLSMVDFLSELFNRSCNINEKFVKNFLKENGYQF